MNESLPYVEGSDTSQAAAESMESSAQAQQWRIYRFLRHMQPFGATCDEIEHYLGLSHQTASARIRGLALKGDVLDSGNRRETRTGRKAIVWMVP